MVQPRPRRIRPPRLKRAMKAYLRAMARWRLFRAGIAHVAELRRDRPQHVEYLSHSLPDWLRQTALDGTPPPEPDIWSFYWRGRGQKNQGPPTPPASAAPDTPPSSPHSPRRRHRPGSRDSGRGCP